jgi:hypothetical protein
MIAHLWSSGIIPCILPALGVMLLAQALRAQAEVVRRSKRS